MMQQHDLQNPLALFSRQLSNGLTVLVQPMRQFPRVDVQLWYHVGSKHEADHEKGMAHFIEHMLFKGTQLLSETDINCITHKLSGYANAFTSQDYTGYVFRLPSNAWHYALMLMADCMTNARFDPQMMASEVKAVVEELRLFRDDYQSVALESLVSALFGMHPYHYPIIGSTFHLEALTQQDLLAFYKKYYVPNNATLLAVGDLDPEDFFTQAEQYFGALEPGYTKTKKLIPIVHDLAQQSITLYREIAQPWVCFAYLTPSLASDDYLIPEIITLLLAGDKSARLYDRLVLQEELVSDIDAFTYDFFEQGMLCIAATPYNPDDRHKIGLIIQEEINALISSVKPHELQAIKKNSMLDYAFLIEQSEKRASFIGTHFLGAGKLDRLASYVTDMSAVSVEMVAAFVKEWLRPTLQHQTHVLPVKEQDKKMLHRLQRDQEKQEAQLLKLHQRTTPMETGRFVDQITVPENLAFTFPQPQQVMLDNGLELLIHDNKTVPYVYIILSFFANAYYDPQDKQGLYMLLLQSLVHETASHEAKKFHKLLQEEGIRLFTSFDSIKLYCLSQDIEKALDILAEVVTKPIFKKKSLELLKLQQISDSDSFWDTPTAFVDQYVREDLFQGTPFAQNPLGSKESISKCTIDDLESCYKKVITPAQATLLITGDITSDVQAQIERRFNAWHGNALAPIQWRLPAATPQKKHYELVRDQTVLALYAPIGITVDSPDYYALQLLDIILMGGGGASASYRLFDVREQTGLFYSIEGSFLYGQGTRPSLALIKTVVTPENCRAASDALKNVLKKVYDEGVSQDEFESAKNVLKLSSVELFETNSSCAHTFLFLKKCKLPFNLFDKQEGFLNILKHDDITALAKKVCNPELFSEITIGRSW